MAYFQRHSQVSFQLLANPYPPFSTMTSKEISCFFHVSKIVNYYNAVAEDIPFIWQKIERNVT